MKHIIKIIAILVLMLITIWVIQTNAAVDFSNVQWLDNITGHSITSIAASWDVATDLETTWFKILTIIKLIVSWLLVIFIVYVWIQMIISMWNDEEKLSTAKRQLYYTVVWLAFINMPWTFYNIFVSRKWQIDGWISWTWSSQQAQQSSNIFINTFEFDRTLNWWIILFIESILFWIAIFMIIVAGIKIITSRWREEQMTEAKNKILWSIVWLIFIWFIEAWQSFIYNGRINDWANLFQTMEELALFFAGPVAIFFLTLAWYYYITSNGDEEKVNKAKSIVINTLIGTVVLLASHAFLKDLITLNI